MKFSFHRTLGALDFFIVNVRVLRSITLASENNAYVVALNPTMRVSFFLLLALGSAFSQSGSQQFIVEKGSMLRPSISDKKYNTAQYNVVRGVLEDETAQRIIELLENETLDEDLDSIDFAHARVLLIQKSQRR